MPVAVGIPYGKNKICPVFENAFTAKKRTVYKLPGRFFVVLYDFMERRNFLCALGSYKKPYVQSVRYDKGGAGPLAKPPDRFVLRIGGT